MSYLNQSQLDAAGLLNLGIHVSKASASLPQSATGNLFTVAGGRVIIRRMIGQVTTAIQSTDPVAKITSTPSSGTAVDVASTVDLSSLEVGGLIVVEGDGTALVKSTAGAAFLGPNEWLCAAGTIDLITGASKTGAIKWDLYYFPYDDGASVVSA